MKVSIILPLKNSEKYLKECLDSVFNQDASFDYELICAIEPSIDNSLNILKEYQKMHQNLVILEEPDKRFPLSRFDAIKASKGEYITFIDSDDLYLPSYLSRLVNEIEKGYDVVNCSFFYKFENKLVKNKFVSNRKFRGIKGCKYLLRDYSIRSFFWNKIYKRELWLEKIPSPKSNKVVFEDLIANFAIFSKDIKIKSIKDPLYLYRQNKKSITHKLNEDHFYFHMSAFALLRYLCEINPNKKLLKMFLHKAFRCKIALFSDIVMCKDNLEVTIRHFIKENKKAIREIFSKKPFILDKCFFRNFIINSMNND